MSYFVGRDGALVEAVTLNRRVVGSTPALVRDIRRLSDALQGRVCNTSPEEIDTTQYPPASFPATDRSQTYHFCRSFSSTSLVSSCRRLAFCRSINRPNGNVIRPRPLS